MRCLKLTSDGICFEDASIEILLQHGVDIYKKPRCWDHAEDTVLNAWKDAQFIDTELIQK